MIKVTCVCGKPYTVPDDWAGRTAKCEQCGAAIDVPEATDIKKRVWLFVGQMLQKTIRKVTEGKKVTIATRLLALVVAASLFVGAMFFGVVTSRYNVINAGSGNIYKHDRWTGKMWFTTGDVWSEVIGEEQQRKYGEEKCKKLKIEIDLARKMASKTNDLQLRTFSRALDSRGETDAFWIVFQARYDRAHMAINNDPDAWDKFIPECGDRAEKNALSTLEDAFHHFMGYNVESKPTLEKGLWREAYPEDPSKALQGKL